MSDIFINTLVNDIEADEQYLVLWVDPNNGLGYWYGLSSRPQKPVRFSVKDVTSGEINGRYELSVYCPPEASRSEESLSDKEREGRDNAWMVIKPIVEAEPDIYDRKLRSQILHNVAATNSIAVPNIYKLLDRYWRGGKTKNALIPRFSNRGAKGVQRKSYKKRYTNDNKITIGKTLTDIDRQNFEKAIRQYYLNRNKTSLKYAYEKLLQDNYTLPNSDGAIKLKLRDPDELPSIYQFRYWYSKNRDTVNEIKKRDGEHKFNLDGRSVLGKSDYGLMGPGAQFQIDATIGDIYLVSQLDPSDLIGRPVLYFVIDAFSRMVTGIGIGLEGPSWSGAMMAIANMAADKVAYCKEYGINITEDEWPCRHVPAVLRGDRGELESRNADNLANMLGIRIENTPAYRADWKGIVEQHFRTINTNSVALLPGSVKPDMSKRGGRDYRLDAALNIRQFTQIIIKCVIYYNNHHYMDYFEKNETMLKDNVDPIPCRLWDWGVRYCSGTLRSFPEEVVRMAVLPTAKASVTEKGIKFKGMFYSSDRAVREAWFEKARSKKTWPVTISYDPRDMAELYVWNQDDKKYDVCYLLDWNQKYAGKYLDEIIYEQKNEALSRKQLKLSETEAKVNLNAEIDAIVSEAKGIMAGLPAKSKKEKVSNIKENRRHELESMRQLADPVTTSVGISANETIASHADRANEDIDPILQMIKSKVEERLKNE